MIRIPGYPFRALDSGIPVVGLRGPVLVNKPPSLVSVWQALYGHYKYPTHLLSLLFIVCGAIIIIIISSAEQKNGLDNMQVVLSGPLYKYKNQRFGYRFCMPL